MNLFVNYYMPESDQRQNEVSEALKKNLNNKHINRVILLSESSPPKHKKIISFDVKDRPTYQDFFNLTEDYPDDVNIIANSDISFNETLEKAQGIKLNECFALSRHEIIKGELVPFEVAHRKCPAAFSQDAWIFKGVCKVKGCDSVLATDLITNKYERIPFTLGVAGCDNVIAHFLSQKYNVKNPYLDIVIAHHHEGKSQTHRWRMTGAKSRWGVLRKVIPSRL